MAIAALIPSIWAARFERILYRNTVYGLNTNVNFEGEVQAYGDTVKIPFFKDHTLTVTTYNEDGTLDASNDRTATPQEVSGGTLDLAIDQQKQWSFLCEDIERVQSRPNLMDAAMMSAGKSAAFDIDNYLRSVYDGAAADVAADAARGVAASTLESRREQIPVATTVDADNGAFGAAFLKALTKLKNSMSVALLPEENRWLICHPDTIMGIELWALQKNSTGVFVPATSEETLRNGFMGNLLGFNLYCTTHTPSVKQTNADDSWRLFAGQGMEAVTFARQINTVESYRSHKAFADVVRGLTVYGAKLVHPDRVYMIEHKKA